MFHLIPYSEALHATSQVRKFLFIVAPKAMYFKLLTIYELGGIDRGMAEDFEMLNASKFM
jgi:hypothetical protein